jgi:V/A-type H+-transporting ATPase subunit C
METSEEIIAAFCKDESITIPTEIMSQFKADGNLGQIEDYLDRFQYIRLIKVIDNNSVASRMFLDYIRRDIDMRNLETIMKLKFEGITGDKVLDYMIPGGKQIDTKFAKQLADYATIPETYPDVTQLDFYDSVKDIIENNRSPLDAAVELRKSHIAQAKKFSSEYPLSVLPVIDFMISMENETRNIRTIARGLESGLDRETVKKLLVI